MYGNYGLSGFSRCEHIGILTSNREANVGKLFGNFGQKWSKFWNFHEKWDPFFTKKLEMSP